MEVDFEKGKINVRDDLVYEFKELVTRKEMKAIKQLRDKHVKLEDNGIEKLSVDEVEELEDEWFNAVLPLGLKDFNKEDLDTMSEGEIRELTASVYIFLTKFGSTALAKQFVTATKEIQPKDQTQ
jgi:tyrosyl-tRNA synthetase